MRDNYEPMFAMVLAGLLIVGAAVITDRLSSIETCEAPAVTGWQPPNVQLCPDDIDLWECIRTVAYRQDI